MNSKNIEAVVGDLDGRIAQLQSLREQLVKFDGELTTGVLPAAPAAEPRPVGAPGLQAKPRGKYKTRGSKNAVPPPENGKPASGVMAAPDSLAKRVAAPTASLPTFPTGEKPNTVGGAMKAIISNFKNATFTRAEVKDALLADADWAKLHTQSPTGMAGNLVYWSEHGRLKRTGQGAEEVFQVTDAEFFNKG